MSKCPICGKNRGNKQDLINHIESDHMDEIPENMSTAQFIYSKTHGRDYGLCRICGNPTEWNDKTCKPMQHCGSEKCKAKIKEIAQQRMLKTYGKVSLLNDMKHQEKMLANRSISGTYTWSDGKHKFTYTGQYEKFAIEWLDKVMDLDPEHIQMPGPVLPYVFPTSKYGYNGEIKYWITDIYLEDFNLIIEIKAGKDENTHPGFELQRELEDAKDKSMLKQNQYNYTKITHKSMMKLIKVLAMIRENNISKLTEKDEKEPVIMINENTITESVNDEEKINLKITNSEINSICESIMNEFTMSIANTPPIVTSGKFEDKTEDNSLVGRLKKIKKMSEDATIDAPNAFSPNQVEAPDPLVAENNFTPKDEDIVNPDIRVDMETDPYNTKENDFAVLSQSNVKSFFQG